ncbi:MAG TPA: transglycosylase domain-containing protein [Longimicrobium sp.]|nr:transglycosylase domain-containing protein [Longimicrobium sp.]
MRFRRRPPEEDDDATLILPREEVPEERPSFRRRATRRVVVWALKAAAGYWVVCALLLVLYRFVWPPVTGVQLQRRLGAMMDGREYRIERKYVHTNRLPEHVPRAVVAAEDGRFWTHSGFDLVEMRSAQRKALGGGRMRGASTITQQLVKNLFGFTTRNPLLGGIRKLYDWSLTPVAELVLGKNRILELYLNSAEWGDGVFGVDAAAHKRYGVPSSRLTRSQAAGLAALLPNPHQRTLRSTAGYRREILRRMAHRGW